MKIVSVCVKDDLNNLISILKIVDIIKIVIPILLIVFVIIKLLMSKELNKSLIRLFIINIVISLLIFFLPSIIFLLNSFINNDKISCMKEIDKDTINIMEIFNKYESELTKTDYEIAYDYYNKIESDDIKKLLEDDIDNLKYLSGYENISEKIEQLIINYKNTFSNSDYEMILNLYNKIRDDKEKDNLKNDIDILKEYNDIIINIKSIASNYDKIKFQEILKKIEEINDENIKTKLKDKLIAARNLPKLNIPSGVTVKNENGKMPYLLAIPENPTEEMPLIVYLHGDWGGGIIRKLTNTSEYIYENVMKNVSEGFIFLAPTVSGYNAQDLNWQTPSVINGLKGLIDSIINEYKINTSRVIIMGHSRGAVGVWDAVSKYPNFFSIAVPVSCGGTSFKAASFKNTKGWGFVGGVGNETKYRNSMRKYVREINEIGGQAKLSEYDDKSHSEMGNVLVDISLYKWILEQ